MAGDWEADLLLFSDYGQAILVTHERYSRLLMLFKLDNKRAATVISHLLDLCKALPKPLARSVTFDNGTEFSDHYYLHEHLKMNTYFCDVKAPWQKGGIENAIGRLRRFLPRKTNIAAIEAGDLQQLASLYNHTPRKCLDYKTPAEVFSRHVQFSIVNSHPSLRWDDKIRKLG